MGIIVGREKETSFVLLEHSVAPPLHGLAERPKLSDPAHGTRGLQPERDGRVRCSAWLGVAVRLDTRAEVERIGKWVRVVSLVRWTPKDEFLNRINRLRFSLYERDREVCTSHS